MSKLHFLHKIYRAQHTLNPQHPQNRNLGVHHSQSAPLDEAKKILPFPKIKPWFVWRISHSLVTTLTELSRWPLLISSRFISILLPILFLLISSSFYNPTLEFKSILQSSGTVPWHCKHPPGNVTFIKFRYIFQSKQRVITYAHK